MDDRKTKEMKDEMERQQRMARRAVPSSSRSPRPSLSTAPPSTLSGSVVDDAQSGEQAETPPPYPY
jgi:hypothetical protein